jgi:hypothetical protein
MTIFKISSGNLSPFKFLIYKKHNVSIYLQPVHQGHRGYIGQVNLLIRNNISREEYNNTLTIQKMIYADMYRTLPIKNVFTNRKITINDKFVNVDELMHGMVKYVNFSMNIDEPFKFSNLNPRGELKYFYQRDRIITNSNIINNLSFINNSELDAMEFRKLMQIISMKYIELD